MNNGTNIVRRIVHRCVGERFATRRTRPYRHYSVVEMIIPQNTTVTAWLGVGIIAGLCAAYDELPISDIFITSASTQTYIAVKGSISGNISTD